MAQWKIKGLSNLTGISVRMLHHYDKIGLLKPAVRTSNGYRLYNEQNLATLQQIIALKFFGFSLGQIKTMVQRKMSIKEQLLIQENILKNQIDHLKQAHETLEQVIERYTASDSLAWNDLITLIERYRMADQIKQSWNHNFDNLKSEYPNEVSAWENMVQKINSKQVGDPEGADGKHAVEVFMKFTKAQLAWGQSKKAGKDAEKLWEKLSNEEILQRIQVMIDVDTPLTVNAEGSIWFAIARSNHFLTGWSEIYKAINENIDADPEGTVGKKIAQGWRELINQQTMQMHSDAVLGLRLWQEMSEGHQQLKGQQLPAQQKKQYVPLYLNPRALAWVDKALKKY